MYIITRMTPEQAIEHFGSQSELARQLGCGRATVSQWKQVFGFIPKGRQYEIEVLTDGKLKADRQ